MTTFYNSQAPAAPVAAPASGTGTATRPRRDWPWVALACALLVASGGVRAWQDHRDQVARDRVVTCPFPLKELPAKLGKWRLEENSQSKLDPQIARIAGAVDSVVRTYFDESTGVAISVVVLFGRAESIVQHVPEVCYPATGFRLAESPYDVAIRGGSSALRFRSLVYGKPGGTSADRFEVYYSFRNNGRWTPEVAGNWRALRYNPGLFKIQTQRLVSEREQRTIDNPTEQFLPELIKVLEERIAAAGTSGAKS